MTPQQTIRPWRRLLPLLLVLLAVAALLLIPLLRATPSGQVDYPDPDPQRGTVAFAQLLAQYQRPDGAALTRQLDELTAQVPDYDSPGALLRALTQAEKAVLQFRDQFDLVSVWYSIDSSLRQAAGEYRYFAQQDAAITEALYRLYAACAESPHAPQLEMTGYGEGFFASYTQPTGESRLAQLEVQEAALMDEYYGLTTGQTIRFDGKSVLWADLVADPNLSAANYDRALAVYYDTYAQPIAQVMAQLIPLRRELATLSGYDSYEAYCFAARSRDYTPAEAGSYAQSVCHSLAPLSVQAEAAGLWPGETLAQPLAEEELAQLAKAAVSALSLSNVSDAWAFMEKYGLCHLTGSPYKQSGAYEVYLSCNSAPFLVLNATGQLADLQTLLHEFGHFYDDYYNGGYTWNMELAETESQGMERLTLLHATGLLPEDTLAQLRQGLLLDGLDTLVWQCLYHTFESRLYQLPDEDLTPDGLHALFLQVCNEFGMGERSSDLLAYGWIDISHFFSDPFYIISYPLSCDAALQLEQLEEGDPGAGLTAYQHLVELAPTGQFQSALAQAGLISPLAEGRVADLANDLADRLGLALSAAA